MKLTRIYPQEMTPEEREMLAGAADVMADKGKKNFPRLIQNIYTGAWHLFRARDQRLEALLVLNEEEGKLNVYYLTGKGLWGKMRGLVGALMDIVRKRGLKALTCVTGDERKARLFSMAPGIEVEQLGSRWFLELKV